MSLSGADLGQIDFQNFSAGCFSTENFDMTTRPVKYEQYSPMIQRVEKYFWQFLWLAQKLPDYLYRFALLYKFKEFERAVWVRPSGRRVKMIS